MQKNRISDLAVAVFAAAILFVATAPTASAVETRAKEAILIDMATGAVLFEKDADVLMAPASMTKIMTATLVFERLKDGRLSLDDTLPVSEEAWRKGSKMFVEVGTRVRVEDLLRGIIVQSGNDASIVIAEGLAGSERAFGDMMTEKARDIGMSSTTFRNSTGWPDPEHLTTARDLAILAAHTIEQYSEFYHLYSEKSFSYNNIKQGNRNPLLYKDIGADGLKTGHTEVSGYGLTASAKRGDRRLVLVVNGLPSVKARSEESERLLDWGFREFENVALFDAGEVVEHAEIWLGDREQVPLVLENDLLVTLPRAAKRHVEMVVRLEEPVPAPVKAGAQLAELVIRGPDMTPIEIPLVAGADAGELDFMGRVLASLKHLVLGATASIGPDSN